MVNWRLIRMDYEKLYKGRPEEDVKMHLLIAIKNTPFG
jgi:hypothetical protein